MEFSKHYSQYFVTKTKLLVLRSTSDKCYALEQYNPINFVDIVQIWQSDIFLGKVAYQKAIQVDTAPSIVHGAPALLTEANPGRRIQEGNGDPWK